MLFALKRLIFPYVLQNWYQRRRRVRPVRDAISTNPILPPHERLHRDEKERQLKQQLARHESSQPRRLVRHEHVVIRRDVPLQRFARKRGHERAREHDLRVNHHRRRNVRYKVREKYRARSFADRHLRVASMSAGVTPAPRHQ